MFSGYFLVILCLTFSYALLALSSLMTLPFKRRSSMMKDTSLHARRSREARRQGGNPRISGEEPLPEPIPGLSQQPHGRELTLIPVSRWDRLSGAPLGVWLGGSLPRGTEHILGCEGRAFRGGSGRREGEVRWEPVRVCGAPDGVGSRRTQAASLITRSIL